MNRITQHELKSGFVLRRLILGFLWGFSILIGIYNCITSIYKILVFMEAKQLWMFGVGIIFCLIPYWTRHAAYQKICLTYQCLPGLNQLLPVSDQKHLITDSEVFRPIEELRPIHSKYTKWDRMESAHWLRIKGYYISKELLIGVSILKSGGTVHSYRRSTYLDFTYANGKTFKIRLEDALHRDEIQNYHRYFAEHCGTTSYLYDPKLLDSINKTYCEFLDDYVAVNGYSSMEEAVAAVTKGESRLQEHIKIKYRHYWDREEKRMKEMEKQRLWN